MSYRVIRVSEDYRVIVVVTPENANPGDESATYYDHNENSESGSEEFWNSTTKRGAMIYFSGIADGIEWGERPDEPFKSLDDIEKWVKGQQDKCDQKVLQEICTAQNLTDSEVNDELIELLEEIEDASNARFFIDRAREYLPDASEAAKILLTAIAESPAITHDRGLTQEVALLLTQCEK